MSMNERLFVNVIESVSFTDAEVGRSEGKMLTAALDLIGYPYTYSIVEDYSGFMTALGEKTVRGVIKHRALLALHLSMHGSSEGVQLMDGKFLPWADLNWKLRLINQKLGNRLVVCLSSCHGFTAATMIRNEAVRGALQAETPFRLLVSNAKAVPWSDAAIGFVTLYHHLAKGSEASVIVKAMRSASGNDYFFGLLVDPTQSPFPTVIGSQELKKSLNSHD